MGSYKFNINQGRHALHEYKWALDYFYEQVKDSLAFYKPVGSNPAQQAQRQV